MNLTLEFKARVAKLLSVHISWPHSFRGVCRLAFGALMVFATCASAQESACGPLANPYGPYDYRTDRSKLGIVERFHFQPEVEALIKGTSGSIGGDLDYTLRAFPNHHRALLTLRRYGERTHSPQPPGLKYPIDCYFDRAIRFRPDDVIVRVLFSGYLSKTGRIPAAVRQLEDAKPYAGENSFSHYNIGLAFFDLGRYDEALAEAQRAKIQGFPRRELIERLTAKGRWVEPPTTPDSDSASAVRH